MVVYSVFDIVVEFCLLSYMQYWFFPLIALAFIGTVPYIIRNFL